MPKRTLAVKQFDNISCSCRMNNILNVLTLFIHQSTITHPKAYIISFVQTLEGVYTYWIAQRYTYLEEQRIPTNYEKDPKNHH